MPTALGSGVDISELQDLSRNTRAVLMEGPYLTQPLQSYPLSRMLVDMKGKMSAPYAAGKTWNVQTSYARNSTSAARPYQGMWESEREDYTTQLRSTTKTQNTHMKEVYDLIEKNEQDKNPTAVGNTMRQRMTANIIGRQTDLENMVVGPHYNDDAEGYNGVLGLLSVFGRSATYSGGTLTYVAQPTPAYNGVYTRLRDGSVTSTKFNKDLSLAANGELVPQVATWDETMSETFLNTIADMALNLPVNWLPSLYGKQSSVSLLLFWDRTTDRLYNRLMNKAGGPRMDDWFGTGEKKIQGVTPVGCPALDNHVLRPNFLVNTDVLYYEKIENMWDREIEPIRVGPTTFHLPRVDQVQLFCEGSLKYAGGLIHKPFSGST